MDRGGNSGRPRLTFSLRQSDNRTDGDGGSRDQPHFDQQRVMTALTSRCHGCACRPGDRSSFDIGGLRSGGSRGSGGGLLARWRLCGLRLRCFRQCVIRLLGAGARLTGFGSVRQKRHLARHQKYACQHRNQAESCIFATGPIHLRTPKSLKLPRRNWLVRCSSASFSVAIGGGVICSFAEFG